MPAKMVNDLLSVHMIMKEIEAEEMNKSIKDAKSMKY